MHHAWSSSPSNATKTFSTLPLTFMMSETVRPDVRQRGSESTLPGDHVEDPAPRLFIWGSAPAELRAPRDASSNRSRQFDGAGALVGGEWMNGAFDQFRSLHCELYNTVNIQDLTSCHQHPDLGGLLSNDSGSCWADIVKRCASWRGRYPLPAPPRFSGSIYMFAPCLPKQNSERCHVGFMSKRQIRKK